MKIVLASLVITLSLLAGEKVSYEKTAVCLAITSEEGKRALPKGSKGELLVVYSMEDVDKDLFRYYMDCARLAGFQFIRIVDRKGVVTKKVR